MFYLLTAAILIIIFLIFPKEDKKQNFLVWLPIAVISYEVLCCFTTGIMTILHIDANIYTVSVCNILLSVLLFGNIVKNKSIQKYYIKIEDIIFIAVYLMIILFIWLKRYTPDLLLRFETSDPGTHLKMAMNFINTKKVEEMYTGQVTNGLFIQSLLKFNNGAYVYKSLLLKYGINFLLSGWMFYAAMIKYADKITEKVLIYLVTILYTLGYPYNDMIFGFVYLQITITIIIYLLSITNFFIEGNNNNRKIYKILLLLGCLGVGVGYTLFAPIAFFAVLICIMLCAAKEKWLLQDGKKFFSIKFIKTGLQIFLIPTLLVLWFLVISPAINEKLTNYGSALNNEGYIYRNLYSDFCLYVIVAFYGVIMSLKEKKNYFLFVFFILGIGYYIIFFYRMITQKVSTYYFYKINYLLWFLILACFIVGLITIYRKEKWLIRCYIAGVAAIFLIYFSGFESKIQQQNINYAPFSESDSFFHIFSINKILEERKSEISPQLIEICNEVNMLMEEDKIGFVGDWLNFYWYEALTNQRFEDRYVHESAESKVTNFLEGNTGKYMVVLKESQEYLENIDLFNGMKLIYENEYAFIAISE